MKALLEATKAVERGLVVSAYDDIKPADIQRKCEEYAREAERFPEFMDEAYFGEAIFKSETGRDHDVAMEVAEAFWWALKEVNIGKSLQNKIDALSKEMASFWRKLPSAIDDFRSKTRT